MENIMQDLSLTEKEDWIKFHESLYKEDLNHAEENLLKFPRWSIISAYYAMHDISKLYIGKVHNKKIVGENVHAKVIEALKILIKEEAQKEKTLKLLEEAKITFFNATRLKERVLPLMLRRGKQERGKAQYYSIKPDLKEFNSQRAAYFIDNIVSPFIKIMKGML